MKRQRKSKTTEADDAGLTRYLEPSAGSSLVERLQRKLDRATESELRKQLADAIEHIKEAA